MPRIFPLPHDTRDLLTRLARPCRNANVSSVRNTTSLQVPRLVDRRVGHPHLRVTGMTTTSLALICSGDHLSLNPLSTSSCNRWTDIGFVDTV